jgi:hypothetical protein
MGSVSDTNFAYIINPLWERACSRWVELNMRGWPKAVCVDALWSRLHPPGPAGSWLLGKMLE